MVEYSQNACYIREANEICKMLGKNISFKQSIITIFEDVTGRKQDDLIRQISSASVQMNEEMNIQVRYHDKNTTVMWSEDTFFDRLEMMRDALNQYEDQKQRAIEKQIEKDQAREEKLMLQRDTIKKSGEKLTMLEMPDRSSHDISMMSTIVQDPFDEIEQDDDFLKELQDTLISQSDDELDNQKDVVIDDMDEDASPHQT